MESKTLKILAIDDIQDNLITLKALINESIENAKVYTALSGKIGLEIAASENPDVILLDILMPEMDGYEVCKTLKADILLKEIPVIFITALKGDKATRIKALEVGADAFLTKPIDESELFAQIKAMVKIKEANFEKINKEKILLDLVAEKTKSLEESNQKALNLLDELIKENEARKLSEQAVIESQEQYKELVKKIPVGVFVLRSKPDGSFAFEYVSPKMEEITQINAQSILENPANAFQNFHPDDLPFLIQANADGIASKKPALIVGRLLIKEKIKWVEISSNPEIQADGDILWHGLIADITEQKLAEIELNNTHQKLEVLMDAIPDLLFEVGLDGTIYNYHTHSTDLLAAPPEVFLGKRFIDILPENASKVSRLALNEAKEKGISTGKQYSLILPNGEFWFDVSVAPIKNSDDEISRYVFLARDVTEQKKSVLELVKLNRTQALNSQINDLIIRIHDKMKLFEEVCQIATTYGNYRMSWISHIDEKTNIISPVVWYGHEDGYLKEIQKISIQKNLYGNGPTGVAFREGKVSVCNNIALDPNMEPWRNEALKRGYLSSIALPITVRKKVIGTFNLYAGEVDFFALDEEVELLENITANIAFSLEKILDDDDRLKAEQKIREKDQEFKKLSANVPDLLYQFTRRPDGTYFVPIASPGIINIFGCTPEDVANDFTAIANVIFPEDAERVINDIEQSAANISNFTCEFRVQIPGKSIQWIYSKSTPEKLADGSVTWYGFNTDITERKNAEEKIRQSEAFNKGILNSLISHISVLNYNGEIIAVNEAWDKFTYQNGNISLKQTGVGVNYFTTCEHAIANGDSMATKVLDGIKDVMNNNIELFVFEYPCHSPTIQRWFEMRVMKFEKETPMIVVSHTDISERKLAEELLLRNTKLLEESQGIAKVGGWELDLATNKLYWTAETYKIHETSPEEFNPTVDAGVGYFLPESKRIISDALDQAMKYGIGYDLYLETYTTKGSIIHVRTTCVVTIEDGKPIKLTGIFQDITEQKLAEQEILMAKEKAEESENKLKVMVSSMPDLVWFKSQDGVYLECNQRFEDFIGFSQE
ncbi:MAG: PAS domain-containing protein, partial [Bacteroidia bacterium]